MVSNLPYRHPENSHISFFNVSYSCYKFLVLLSQWLGKIVDLPDGIIDFGTLWPARFLFFARWKFELQKIRSKVLQVRLNLRHSLSLKPFFKFLSNTYKVSLSLFVESNLHMTHIDFTIFLKIGWIFFNAYRNLLDYFRKIRQIKALIRLFCWNKHFKL